MLRARAALGPLALALLASPAAAEEYLPLAPGHTWVYDCQTETTAAVVRTRDEATVTARCRDATRIDGRACYRVEWSSDDPDQDVVIWVASGGGEVHVLRSSGRRLPLVPKLGGRERVRVEVDGQAVVLEERATRPAEPVQVPAGDFEAVPVTSTVAAPAVRVVTTTWYARGVGAVKIVETVEAPATRVARTFVLREFRADGGGAPGPREERETVEDLTPEGPVLEREDGRRGGLRNLVRRVAGGDETEADWDRVGELAEALLARAREHRPEQAVELAVPVNERVRRGAPLILTGPTRDRLVAARGVQATTFVRGSVVVCDGDVAVAGYLRGAVLLVDGDVEVTSYVRDCVVVATGEVEVAGYVRDSVVLARRSLEVGGYVEDAVVQADELEAPRVEDAVLVRTGLDAIRSRGVRHEDRDSLWDVVD